MIAKNIKPEKSETSGTDGHEGRLDAGTATHLSSDGNNHLTPRKRPRQKRAKQTCSAILEAAAEVFAEKGYSGATTNKIALRAGVSIGSLYQYFPNKDAILAGLRERHLSDVQIVVKRSLLELADVTIPIDRALGSLLRGLIDLHETDPKLTRALADEVVPPHLVELALHKKEAEHYARQVERILARRSDVRSDNLVVAAHVLVQTTQALTRWFVHEAPRILDKEAFLEEVLYLLTRYVQERPGQST